ncbi:hypothetical protein UF70_1852 [Staphylococcus pasteuri]|nr:hypothetical protein UF70_1852 [Staphylococcus pasteuri]
MVKSPEIIPTPKNNNINNNKGNNAQALPFLVFSIIRPTSYINKKYLFSNYLRKEVCLQLLSPYLQTSIGFWNWHMIICCRSFIGPVPPLL